MAENTTDLGDASGSRQEKVSKINFLKVAVKKLKREGSGIRFVPFRSSSDGWISFREYESRFADHRTKSKTNGQVESVTPHSEVRESVQRIRYDETQVDQLPTLEQGHVRKIVASLEKRLPAAQSTRQKLTVKEISDADVNIGNDAERAVGRREEGQGSIDTKVPQDVVHNVSSFRPLHFSNNVPNPKCEWNLQRPVAVVKSAGDPSAGQKITMSADDKGKGEGDVDAMIFPRGSEKYAQDVKVGKEASAKDAPSETQRTGSGSDVKKIGVETIPRQTQSPRRRLYIMKRDNKDKSLKEEEPYEVGDTIETGRSATGGYIKQEKTAGEGSGEVKATGTETSGADTPDMRELNKMPHAKKLDYESSQRSAVMGHMMNVFVDQDASHESEEHMTTTESTRTDGNRRRKERLLGLLTPSFYRP